MNIFQLALLWAFFFTTATIAAALDPQAILEAAEQIRNPQEDYQIKLELEDIKNKRSERHTYQTLVKGRTKSLVRFLAPPEDKGTKVLMVDDQMWVYIPTTAKPIRIAARQRLTGNAAYGDIVRLGFVDNYKPTFLRSDVYKGAKAQVLQLDSMSGRPVTYDRIEYWVEAKTNRPLKALYETSSGKVLREGYFEAYQTVFGVNRPTKIILVDHLQPDHVTNLVFSEPKKTNLPDLLFQKQNFGRN